MIVFKKSIQLSAYITRLKGAGKNIGFVPTMGALHNGHSSLLAASMANNDITVCSIFINPAQFNDPDDFRKYPVTIEKDLYLLEQSGTGILFLPSLKEIYPEGLDQLQNYDLGNLENILEGNFRPNHFQGVSQVMSRLLTIVQPHNLYMGQKDYQQCMVVQRLLKIMQSATVLNRCPTQREPDGLAMSSRNIRLSEEARKKAVAIFTVLNYMKDNLEPGSTIPLITKGEEMLESAGFKTDYVVIADKESLEKVSTWNGQQQLVALVAASLNNTRLIDNMLLTD